MNDAMRGSLAGWLADEVGDMEVDRESLRSEHGFDFVQAVKDLASQVRAGEPIGPMPGSVKIVETDNFGRDYADEKVVAENITSARFAYAMCEALNVQFSGECAQRIYRVVPHDYQLQPGFEP